MNLRMEQAYKVMKILDDVLANRPNERGSLLIATLSAFTALAIQEQNASKESTADVLEDRMSDLISRQAAIESIKRNAYRHTYLDQIIDIIKDLPSAQPERETGEWIWKDRPINKNYTVTGITKYGEETTVYVHEEGTERRNYCSVCGKLGDDTFMNFCPNCGADMRGVS